MEFLISHFLTFSWQFLWNPPLSILQECQQHSTPNMDRSSFIHSNEWRDPHGDLRKFWFLTWPGGRCELVRRRCETKMRRTGVSLHTWHLYWDGLTAAPHYIIHFSAGSRVPELISHLQLVDFHIICSKQIKQRSFELRAELRYTETDVFHHGITGGN